MTFVSYAQNAEDVMLRRALGDVERGFWIDVGAADPDDLSVTRAFHDRGWTGINVEPNRLLFDRLVRARPLDVNLSVALGTVPGERRFHVFGDTGLSCFDDAVAAAHREAGFDDRIATVPVSTLAAVCRRHAPDAIHFLKVDVEGAEAEVLGGADWTRHRPWIVLVEATRPLSPEPTHELWEGELLLAGYRFVWFDGVNRFYVAAEHHDRLGPRFDAPPNAFDDWTRGAEAALLRRAERAEGDRSVALAGERRHREALGRARADVGALRRLFAEGEARLGGERRRADAEAGAAAALRDALAVERGRLDRLAFEGGRPAPFATARLRAGAALDRARALASHGARTLFREADRRSGGALRRAVRPAPPPALPPPETAPAASPPPPPPPVLAVATGAPVNRATPTLRGATPIRTVHQYHHATATGDAVTASLFVVRRHLRALGFRSDIFAALPHAAHRDEVRPVDELPLHADCVLLVHHSLGDPLLERLLALPARTVLVYHNITPARLLGAEPGLAELARVGRRQLDRWRDRAVAALTPSEPNAIELRRHGFDAVSVLPGLLDIAPPAAEPATEDAAALRRDGVLTVLFVGRVVPSKGQVALVEAFAAFRRRIGDQPARLVLVGDDFGGDRYRAEIVERAASLGVGDDALVLAGPLDDRARDAWYRRADLYVSMSEHEGFGVPLVEAMRHGVPVLARRAGAVAFTLGEAGVLVDGGPDEMGDRMAELAADRELRDAVLARQRRRLDELKAGEDRAALLAALALAGAVPPAPVLPATALAIRRELRITVAGHANGSYSLAAVNRALALALDEAAPGRTVLLPVEEIADAPLHDVPDDEYVRLASLASAGPVRAAPHVAISQHYPLFVPAERDLGSEPDRLVAFFFWEETLVPERTIRTLDERFDAVLAPSRFVERALRDSGLRIPVRVVGHAPPLGSFAALATRPERGHARPFTFLHVSSGFPRKGLDVLLEAWAEAFEAGDAVKLVLKTFPNPHNTIRDDLASLRDRCPALAEIVLLDSELDAEDLRILYLGADAFVLPTRGEGFNIPAAEAVAVGLPLIVSGAGGHLDFVDRDTATLLDGHHVPAATHLSEPGSLWFEPDRASLVEALRRTAERRAEATQAASLGRDRVLRRLDPARFGERVRDTVAALLERPAPPPARRAAILTTWDVRCGIAEYSRRLVEARPPEFEATLTVLADRRTPASADVRPVWEWGQGFDPDATAGAIAAVDPDILLVEHQPGLVSWAALAALLDDRRLEGRTVAVTLHNTRHLWMIGEAERRPVLSALRRAARVIVHRPDEFDRFRREGFDDVVWIAQGAPPVGPEALRARERDPAGRAVIGAYGFLLPQKGFGRLVEAFALLRERRPDARLRMVTAVYDENSLPLRDALLRRADELGIAGAIDWHTEFLPHDESIRLLSGCDVVALPYEGTLEASSAALRTALSCLRPVAVTPIDIFGEAGDAVAVLGGSDPEPIRAGIEALLDDEAGCRALVERQAAWLAARDWTRISRRTFGMLDGLHRARAERELDRSAGGP